MREIETQEFEATCLELIDEVAETGEEIEIVKDGKAIARLVPFERSNLPAAPPTKA